MSTRDFDAPVLELRVRFIAAPDTNVDEAAGMMRNLGNNLLARYADKSDDAGFYNAVRVVVEYRR